MRSTLAKPESMRLPALILLVLPMLLSAGAAAQATLNKCIDANGRVTYSNLPCRGAHEVKRVEIDPPPPKPKPAMPPTHLQAPAPAQPPAATILPQAPSAPTPPAPLLEAAPVPPAATPLPAPAPSTTPLPVPTPPRAVPPSPAPALPRAELPTPAKRVTPRTCDTLTDQLGRVLDQMDAAQRTGVTQQQIDTWTKEIQDLERKKREASCF